MPKVSNADLLEAGLEAMIGVGKPMKRIKTGSRAMKFQLDSDETVRVRTCNDHVLVVLADSSEKDASLNIEGTDYLLIVMPEVPRTDGPTIVYLVPTAAAVKAARQAHAQWLNSNPATGGNNRTWNIWFRDGPAAWEGFAGKWAKYRLHGGVSTPKRANVFGGGAREGRSLGEVIAEARKAIAQAAGVDIEAVKISVALD